MEYLRRWKWTCINTKIERCWIESLESFPPSEGDFDTLAHRKTALGVFWFDPLIFNGEKLTRRRAKPPGGRDAGDWSIGAPLLGSRWISRLQAGPLRSAARTPFPSLSLFFSTRFLCFIGRWGNVGGIERYIWFLFGSDQ